MPSADQYCVLKEAGDDDAEIGIQRRFMNTSRQRLPSTVSSPKSPKRVKLLPHFLACHFLHWKKVNSIKKNNDRSKKKFGSNRYRIGKKNGFAFVNVLLGNRLFTALAIKNTTFNNITTLCCENK